MMPGFRPSIRWNLAANLGGQVWRALMSLAFVPVYLRILGVEAFGLIGLYASLQLTLGLLDIGLRPALAREMARFTGGGIDLARLRTLLRSVELCLAAMALLIAVIMLAAAPWLARDWVNPRDIHPDVVAHAFMAMGLVAALQFIEVAYDTCLAGLQRQVIQNVIVTIVATLRGFGAVAVLWFAPQITAFFLWQAVVAMLSLLALRAAVYRSLPPAAGPARFSLAALAGVRGYAVGMFGIAALTLLLTHSDKFLLSRFMPLSDVGHYMLAASLVGAIAMFSTPIGGTFYPVLTARLQAGDEAGMVRSFHHLNRLMLLAVGTAAAMFVAFGERLMNVWIHDPAASGRAAPVMALLAMSALFNALTTPPYMLQLAHGVTRLTLQINAALLVVFAPIVYFLISRFGAIGAGAYIAALAFAGLVLSAGFTFRRFLPPDARRQWLRDIGVLGLVLFGAAFALRAIVPQSLPLVGELLLLLGCGGSVLAAGVLADREYRGIAFAFAQRALRRWGRRSGRAG